MGHVQPRADSRQPRGVWRLAFLLVASATPLVAPELAAQGGVRSTQHPTPNTSKLPRIPLKTGPLALQLVYPGPTDVIDAGDSSFVFGQIGDGRTELMINGQSVPVAPNGAFLGWIRIPTDTLVTLQFEAGLLRETLPTSYLARRP